MIRVDTGNMRDTTHMLADGTIPNDGDDITKAATALALTDKYPPPDPNSVGADYEGEGVYWYDIEMDGVNDGSGLRRAFRYDWRLWTLPEIRELDINPLLADANGVIALDARVALKSEQNEPRVPMAIAPYPADWEK